MYFINNIISGLKMRKIIKYFILIIIEICICCITNCLKNMKLENLYLFLKINKLKMIIKK